MRKLVQTIVPLPLRQTARDARDLLYLAMVHRHEFNAAQLCQLDAIPAARIFQDTCIAKTWQQDHAAIVDVFGDEDMFGGICPGERRALYYLVRGLKSQRVLEVGTHIGASTLYIARALAANGIGHLTTVDVLDVNDPLGGPWKEAGMPMSPRDLARRLGCSTLIDFVANDSLTFLQHTSSRFDLVFLDGDHRPHVVYQEVALALNVLAPGGVILLHDYYPGGKRLWPGLRAIRGPYRALERVSRHNRRLVAEPLGNLPWPTKLGVHTTSLAWLSRRGPARTGEDFV